MIAAICLEIKLQKEYLKNEKIESIYFGGGTPSLLNEGQLNQIFESIYSNYTISNEAEITLEANPDDITPQKLRMLSKSGVNRLSLGIQSFNDEILKWMNRAHHSTQALDSLNHIKESDFVNFSVDLIYGIPIGSHAQWKKDLLKLISFEPPHISSYCLTIEPSTVFGKRQKQGKLSEATEEYAADQFNELVEVLYKNGYEHYEISNFALPGKKSKHNSAYWQHKMYLGIGPGAHSYNRESRQYNISNNPKYIKAIKTGVDLFEKEELSVTDQINEYLMTSLRTSEGCNLNFLKKQYDYNLIKHQGVTIEQWKAQSLCIQSNNQLFLTQKGKLLADKLASDLFIVT